MAIYMNGYVSRYGTFAYIHEDELESFRTDLIIGSKLTVIETGDEYILDEEHEWVKIGGTTEDEVTEG